MAVLLATLVFTFKETSLPVFQQLAAQPHLEDQSLSALKSAFQIWPACARHEFLELY